MPVLTENRPLSGEKITFCREYVKAGCKNATGAYLIARPYGRDNYDSSRVLANQWLRDKQIRDYIDDLRAPVDGYRRLATGRKREILHDFAESPQIEPKDRMAAIALDSKYEGDFAVVEAKIEVGGHVQVSGLFASVAMAAGSDAVVECNTTDYTSLLD